MKDIKLPEEFKVLKMEQPMTASDEQLEILNKLQEVHALCFDINLLTTYCASYWMQAYTSTINVTIVRNKADFNDEIFDRRIIYSMPYLAFSEVVRELNELIFELNEFLGTVDA